MPADLAEQVPLVHEACEALGVPILTSARFEADDVIGTLAMQARARGLRRRDRHRRQGLLPARRRRHRASTTRATRAPGTTREGVVEKFGVRPGSGRGRAGADGRQHRQHQGRARHRRKGRARVDRRRTARSMRCSRRAPAIAAEAVSRGAASRTPSRRARAANWRASAPTCPSTFDAEAAALSRPVARAMLRAVLDAGIPHAGAGVRADGGDRPRATIAVVASLDEIDDWSHAMRGARHASAIAAIADGSSAVTRDDRRLGVLGRSPAARATCRSVTPAWPTRPTCRRARSSPGWHRCWPTRPIAKIGHDLKFADDRRWRATASALAGVALDTMVASYLLDATRSSHDVDGLALERTQLSGRLALTRSPARASRRVALDAVPAQSLLTFAAERADLPLTLAPGLIEDLAARRARRRLPRPRAAADSGARGHRARRRQGRYAGAGAAGPARCKSELDDLARRIFGHAGQRVQHQLAEAARRGAVRAS